MFGPKIRIVPAARFNSSCRARPSGPLSPNPLARTMAACVPIAASCRTASVTFAPADEDDGGVGRLRQRGDVRIAAMVADRIVARINRVDCPRKAVLLQISERTSGQLGRVRRRADDSDAARPQESLESFHQRAVLSRKAVTASRCSAVV